MRPYGNAIILRLLVEMPDDLLATLGRQFGDWDSQDLTVAHRIQPEIRLLDRLLDRGQRRLVERLHDEKPRLGSGERGELNERGLGAVVVCVNPFEQSG